MTYLEVDVGWNKLGLEREEVDSDDASRRVNLCHVDSPDTSASTKVEDASGVLGQGRQVQLVVQKQGVLAVTQVMLDQLANRLAGGGDVDSKGALTSRLLRRAHFSFSFQVSSSSASR